MKQNLKRNVIRSLAIVILLLVGGLAPSSQVYIPYGSKQDGQAPTCSQADDSVQPDLPPCTVSGECTLNPDSRLNRVIDNTCVVTDKNGNGAVCSNPREYDGICRDKKYDPDPAKADDPHFSFSNAHCDTDSSDTDNVKLDVDKACPAQCNLYVSGRITELRGEPLGTGSLVIDCGPTCEAGFEKLTPPTKVTLNASLDTTACPGFTIEWSGCSASGDSCTVTMSSDKNVTASCKAPTPSPTPPPSCVDTDMPCTDTDVCCTSGQVCRPINPDGIHKFCLYPSPTPTPTPPPSCVLSDLVCNDGDVCCEPGEVCRPMVQGGSPKYCLPSPSPSPSPSPPACLPSDAPCSSVSDICCNANQICRPVIPGGTQLFCLTSCFVPGTKVTLANGKKVNIEDLKQNDMILSFDEKGNFASSVVGSLIARTVNQYLEVKTSHGVVKATEEHPFYTGKDLSNGADSEYQKLSTFKVGDSLVINKHGRAVRAKILSIKKVAGEITVYNLHNSDGPPTFIADDFIVHNK